MRLFVITASLFATTQAFACGMYIPVEMNIADIGSVMEKVEGEQPNGTDLIGGQQVEEPVAVAAVEAPVAPIVVAQAVEIPEGVEVAEEVEPVIVEQGRKHRKKNKRKQNRPNS